MERVERVERVQRVQRIAAYCVIHDDQGRILLTEIAPPVPAAGRWTLPGGGLEFGEHPQDAARREVFEEAGLHVEIGDLLDIDSFSTQRDGRDWHGIRIVYRARVTGGRLGIVDVGGSTSDVGWFAPDDANRLSLVPFAAAMLERYGTSSALRKVAHVQLAIPKGAEPRARNYWCEVLGLVEVPKPPGPSQRGGAWFATPDRHTEVHVGIEEPFRPARKAHPAFHTSDLDTLAATLTGAGYDVRWSDEIPGSRRFHTDDPFGNRLEFC